MKKHIVRGILIVAIVALVTTFAGSASAAGRHHHHQKAPHHGGASYAPRVYSQYPSYSGYGGGQPSYGGHAVPHYDFRYTAPHHDYYHHDYYHDSYHGYHHDSHHGW